uniref:Nuclear receptor domain-containing protein n=2 Tax=Caenorhabditis tropicalis TaxID=1561998 RepID=A0A1I7UBH3_9PELO
MSALVSQNSNLITKTVEKCLVCGMSAYGYNYGVLSCNACKMFFRRVKVDKVTYTCPYSNKCYDEHNLGNISYSRCRSCRYQKCNEVGMRYIAPGQFDIINTSDAVYTSLISDLLSVDAIRRHKTLHCYTEEDPTIYEMVVRSRGTRMYSKSDALKVKLDEWGFLGIYATVEMFLSFDFMEALDVPDKVILLQNFALKSMLFTGGMRSLMAKLERVMTPDGQDVYPDYMFKMPFFSADFLNGIRSRLVARLRELNVTMEEHVLLNATLFCNPALPSLSSAARKLITMRQRIYSSALLQYCFVTYQQSGPSRFADLLSAHCCNACKMFFRRIITLKTPLRPCENNDKCFEALPPNFECRLCRFQKCITAGMICNQEQFDLPSAVLSLTQLEIQKRHTLEYYQPARDFTFEEATSVENVGFVLKPSDVTFTSYDWEAMTQLATTDYLKKLNFSKMLTSSDLKAFLKGAYYNCALISTAMHYYSYKSGIITFPGGMDVCPKEMALISQFKPCFEIGIKSRLIGKLAELKVTNEEFVLLNMIFICNTGMPGMSKTGNLLLANYQRLYSNLLFKQCQMTCQNQASARFTDLLSLCHIVSKTKQDVANAALLLQMYQPNIKWKDMLKEAIKYMLENK